MRTSIFHAGERLVQTKTGRAEKAAGLADYVRTYMPEQHADFFNNQPLLYLGTRDGTGHVWGSALVGRPGFVQPQADKKHWRLKLEHIHPSDPATLTAGGHVGALGIELHTRRRNRLNSTVMRVEGDTILMSVDISMGNCPKYIQSRHFAINYAQLGIYPKPESKVTRGGSHLKPELLAFVRAADTMFVASCFEEPITTAFNPAVRGCDMSHRGGAPGFVVVRDGEETTLQWPDYAGNNAFMTLGNIAANPEVGLLFVDFLNGDTLHLSGSALIDYTDTTLPGAQRSVMFKLREYVHIKGNLPLSQVGDVEFSPYNPAAPVIFAPPTATSASPTPAAPSTLQALEVLRVVDEAPGVKTYWLGAPRVESEYLPGQYAVFDFGTLAPALGLTGDTTRTWTISSSPCHTRATKELSISVKRVGRVTGWMHDNLRPGMHLTWKATAGEFTLSSLLGTRGGCAPPPPAAQPDAQPPVVGLLLLAAGIGITPFKSMLAGLGRCTCTTWPVTLVYSVRGAEDAAFLRELLDMSTRLPAGAMRVVLALTGASAAATVAASRLLADAAMDGRLQLPATAEAGRVKPAGAALAGTAAAESPPVQAGLAENSATCGEGESAAVAAGGAASRANIVVYGRVGEALLREVVGADLSSYVTAMCGPEGFMQSCEEALGALGVLGSNIHKESFDF